MILPGGHFDAYVDGFDVAAGAATAWFSEHLLERSEPGTGRFSRAAGTVGAAG